MRPFAVRCGDNEYVLFRDPTGLIRALADQCAHRRAPLSLGGVTPEGFLQCPYHGWRYDGSGACVAIPNLKLGERVPHAYRVDAFAVVEEAGWIHLWTGGATADTAPPSIQPSSATDQWHGETLIAYPHDALVDLLLDAPSLVLNCPRLTLFDLHRFGDPDVDAEFVHTCYAAALKTSRRSNRIIADFCYSVALRVRRDGSLAFVEIRDETGSPLSSLIVSLYPTARSVTAVQWRGAVLAATADAAFRIEVRTVLDARAINRVNDYCSRLRKVGGIANSTEEVLHDRLHA